jgi:Type II CAAX prenyl endopeptidase Rce1-like
MLSVVLFDLPVRAIDLSLDRSKRLARRGPIVFAVVFAALALGLANVLASFAPRGPDDGESFVDALDVIASLVVEPLLETVAFQSGLAAITRAFGGGDRLVLFTTTIPFALLHRVVSVRAAFAALVLGFFLALSLVVWSRRSSARGYWVTVLVHAVFDLFLCAIAVTGSSPSFER